MTEPLLRWIQSYISAEPYHYLNTHLINSESIFFFSFIFFVYVRFVSFPIYRLQGTLFHFCWFVFVFVSLHSVVVFIQFHFMFICFAPFCFWWAQCALFSACPQSVFDFDSSVWKMLTIIAYTTHHGTIHDPIRTIYILAAFLSASFFVLAPFFFRIEVFKKIVFAFQ